MRCLAVCQDELVIRMLDEILLPGFEVEFIVENRPLARRLHDAGVHVTVGDPRRTDTFLKADLGPSTCVIIEDNGRRSPKKILEAVRDAGGTLVYVLGIGAAATRRARGGVPRRVPRRRLSVDVGAVRRAAADRVQPLADPRARAAVPAVSSSDADRVLIMLHNDPDPDAMASGLALRNVLRRTKTTAIIGAIQGVTRPENLRMVNLLDIHVEAITAESLKEFDRIAMVDVQPHYFGGLIDRVDLVIDHHPEQPGYTAVFKDIRADYGSTSTILTEHLRAVDVNISERTATAMLYAIKSDTLFFNRQTNRVDIEAFSYLYPLADAALIRKMEGAEITLERLDYVMKAHRGGTLADQVFCGFLGPSAARGLHPLRRRLLPAARRRQVDGHRRRSSNDIAGRSRCGTSATRRTPASSCGGSSPTSAAPAAIAPWPRRSCRCARSARSSAT